MWAGLEYALGVYAGFFRTSSEASGEPPPPGDEFCYESGGQYVDLPGTSGNYISTPDSVANSITGDIDIRVKLSLDAWISGSFDTLIAKRDLASTNPAWRLSVAGNAIGQFDFTFWPGDGGAFITKGTAAAPGFVDGTVHWIRVTLDVDNGAGGNTAQFYTSDDGVTWVAFEGAKTTAGVETIIDTTAPLIIGGTAGQEMAGNVYYGEVRNGIDGPIVASFNADSAVITGPQTPNTVVGGGGETWTINGSGWVWGESTEICVDMGDGTSQFEPTPQSNVEDNICVIWCTQN